MSKYKPLSYEDWDMYFGAMSRAEVIAKAANDGKAFNMVESIEKAYALYVARFNREHGNTEEPKTE